MALKLRVEFASWYWVFREVRSLSLSLSLFVAPSCPPLPWCPPLPLHPDVNLPALHLVPHMPPLNPLQPMFLVGLQSPHPPPPPPSPVVPVASGRNIVHRNLTENMV